MVDQAAEGSQLGSEQVGSEPQPRLRISRAGAGILRISRAGAEILRISRAGAGATGRPVHWTQGNGHSSSRTGVRARFFESAEICGGGGTVLWSCAMVRATVQARRVQRLQQLRNQDAAYSAQLAVESKRSRHAAEDAAMASLGQEFEAERAARELQLQEQYNTAMAGIGQGHALAREAEAHIVARASEQYWSFVRAQQAEQHRSQAAREEAKNARQHREAPRTDLLKRLHRVKEVEQDRAAAAAAAAATRQPPAAMEVVERDPTHTPSTATHLHAVRTPVVVREAGAANATAFEAARAESEKAAAARRKDADAEAARIKAAADRGKEALARMKSDQVCAKRV